METGHESNELHPLITYQYGQAGNVDTGASNATRASTMWNLVQSATASLDLSSSSSTRYTVGQFLIRVAWHEGDNLTTRVQYGNGPARSFFQFEAPRAKDACMYAIQKESTKQLLTKLANAGDCSTDYIQQGAAELTSNPYFPSPVPIRPQRTYIENLLLWSDLFGIYLARIAFMMNSAQIPAGLDAQANYWFTYWKGSDPNPTSVKNLFKEHARVLNQLLPAVAGT